MTKEQLRDYIPMRAELKHLEALARRLEPCGTQELLTAYAKKRADLSAALLEIEQAIDTLGPTERRLMRLRYIDGLSWEAICRRINYSWRQIHRIHSQALIKIKER